MNRGLSLIKSIICGNDYFHKGYFNEVRQGFEKAVLYNIENDILDNGPIQLYISIEQFESFNKGKPYFHCHIYKVDKETNYKQYFVPCEYRDYTHYIGALNWVSLDNEKRYSTLNMVGKWEPDMPRCLRSLNNEILFSCRMLPDRSIEIDNVSTSFNIENVFVRSDIVTNTIKYKGNIYHTRMDCFTLIS